jgi:hypothetical protein
LLIPTRTGTISCMAFPVDNLLNRISDAAHCLPGAAALYLFGSYADPAAWDVYSDLDLQIITTDFPLSRAAWPWILCRAGEIELAYPLSDQAQETAYCISFAQESPYHKVDIGICDQNSASFFHRVEKKVLLWQQAAPGIPLEHSFGPAVSPRIGTPAHFLFGELLGSLRYAKARRRGQHLTCWRFLSAKLNALLRTYAWDGDEQNFPPAPLSTWDYTALDRSLPEADRLALLREIDLRSPQEMDHVLLNLTHQIAGRISSQSQSGDKPAARLVRKYLLFLEAELSQKAEI